jgi:hypothetical protein
MLNEPLTPVKENEATPMSKYFVGRKVVNDRVTRYMKGKHKTLTDEMKANGLDGEESKFVWYPKDYIETILAEMDRYGANGLRIYFGQYDNEQGEPAPGQLGLLLVLTQMKSDGNIYDLLFEEQEGFAARIGAAKSRGIDHKEFYGNKKPREFNAMIPCPSMCLNQVPAFPEDQVS